MGDFNINLLNYDSHTDTSEFLDQMVSRCFLPHVFIHPTRVKDHCATVIDNIFSNNTEFETLSGNILTQIADQFPQMMILKKVCPNLKECSLASYDYSGFDQKKFIDDYTGVKLDPERNEDVNMMFSRFFAILSDCVERHVPLKKISKKSLKSKPSNSYSETYCLS